MNYEEAKNELIQEWGVLGSAWGINKTEAQIHGLLMISPEPLSVAEIMEQLQISRGNVSMSLRALMDWGIVYKKFKLNERKEFFASEKDVWALATKVAEERQKRELKPVIKMLERIQNIKDADAEKEEVNELNKMSKELLKFAKQCDKVLKRFSNSDSNWFFSTLVKLIR